jgi:hypothetical protein
MGMPNQKFKHNYLKKLSFAYEWKPGKNWKKNLKELIPDDPDDAIDYMEKLFTFEPK